MNKALFWLTILTLFSGRCLAQKILGDEPLDNAGSRVEVRSVFDPLPPTGYAPIRVVATNAQDRDVALKLDMSSSANVYRMEHRHRSEFSLDVPTRSTQSATFLVPLAVNYGDSSGSYNNQHQLLINLTGSGIGRPSFNDYNERVSSMAAIAISRVLADRSLASLVAEVERRMKAASRYGNASFGSRFDPADLPEDWRGLSGFDIVMISSTEWLALKPGVRLAMAQWVRLGGRLHLFNTPGTSTDSLGLPPEVLAGKKNMSLGRVGVFSWDGKFLPTKETVERYWSDPQWRANLTSGYANLESSKPHWLLLRNLGERSFASWQVILFLVVFGLLVGPVNLFLLAPAGRRHRLFITTPILSVGASLLMVVIILLQDGIGGEGRRITVVNLEPAEAAGFVIQEQVSRTGVLIGSGFELKQAACIEPLALPDTPWVKLKNGTDSQSVVLGQQGAQRSGNYYQSRAEQGQILRAALSTRARFEVKAGPKPELISALGFTAQQVFYVDAEGKVWKSTGEVNTGQPAAFEASDMAALRTWWREVVSPLGDHFQDRLEAQVAAPRDMFFATATSVPGFTLDTLSSIRWQDDQMVLFGSVPTL